MKKVALSFLCLLWPWCLKICGMTRWLSTPALFLAASVALGAQAPGPFGSLHPVQAAERPERDPASRHERPDRVGERLVSRRLGQRAARAVPASRTSSST